MEIHADEAWWLHFQTIGDLLHLTHFKVKCLIDIFLFTDEKTEAQRD